LITLPACCTRHAEPRWLLRSLPGEYPEIVYYVPTEFPAVALTIDDGVDPETTPAILDVLRAHDATATFFLISDSIPGNEALVQRILREGHEIGHHMTADEVTVNLDADELSRKFNRAADTLERFAPVAWFRPGSGRFNDEVLQLTRARGYRIALASTPPLDTVFRDADFMAATVNWMLEAGSVVVLHDRGERGRRTIATLDILLPEIEGRGYSAVSLSQLDAHAGVRYTH
jgi:peptidoglycan/xylan/chitin deacetylase (PgdA/CDA1 family)